MGFALGFGSSWTAGFAFDFGLVAFTLAGDVCVLPFSAFAEAAVGWPDDFCEVTFRSDEAGVGCCLDDLRIDFSFPMGGFDVSSSSPF
jgi:hypothetical protein